jgi:hypothetical protein
MHCFINQNLTEAQPVFDFTENGPLLCGFQGEETWDLQYLA